MPRTRHYHVGRNMCGYMPDSDVETYQTRKDAEDALRWHRESWLDFIADTPEGEDPYRIIGSIRSGHLWIERGEYAVDIHCWIEPCDHPDCQEEEDY